jgi:hypothetical protein
MRSKILFQSYRTKHFSNIPFFYSDSNEHISISHGYYVRFNVMAVGGKKLIMSLDIVFESTVWRFVNVFALSALTKWHIRLEEW